MREEDLIKMIKDSADEVVVPERLKPENMMKELHETAAEAGSGTEHTEAKRKRRFWNWKYGTVAAALLAVSLIMIQKGPGHGGDPASSVIVEQGSEAASEAAEQGDNPEAEAGTEAESSGIGVGELAETERYVAGNYDEIYDRFEEVRAAQEEQYEVPTGGMVDEIMGGWTTDIMEDGAVVDAVPEADMPAAGAGSSSTTGSSGSSASTGSSGSIGNSGQVERQTTSSSAPDAPAGSSANKEIMEQAEEADTGAAADNAYYGTNVQVEGVDEGDVVKTDGTYIYVSSADSGTIRIIRPDGRKLSVVGEIPDSSTVENSRWIEEFYINDDKMTVIRSSYEAVDSSSRKRVAATEDVLRKDIAYFYPYAAAKSITIAETYDLSDPAAPKLTGTIVQDGYYKSSRRNGDYVYLFTGFDGNVFAGRDEVEQYVPQVNGKTLPAECIYLPDVIETYSYLVVSSVDMHEPGVPVQSKAVAASGEHYYVSGDNIYIGSSKYDFRADQYDYTELMKFSYRDGRISLKAHGNVDGYLNNQFSMDEYQGNLRLVSTLSRNTGKTTNSLYILDSDLKKIGEIKDLAPDEQIYSARFMGDIGYFVTFRNMDPLFSVDLSDPHNPKILGELKITGFSEYLHPYMDGLLLGIGREINPVTGNFEGLKLSMFDTSNPKNVKEVQKVVEADYQYSPAWNNHKSVLISPTRNLIGFTVENYDYSKREWKVEYTVYSYDRQKGFEQKMATELDTDNDYYMTRGLYIGDWLYVVENNRIKSFSLKDFSAAGDLRY